MGYFFERKAHVEFHDRSNITITAPFRQAKFGLKRIYSQAKKGEIELAIPSVKSLNDHRIHHFYNRSYDRFTLCSGLQMVCIVTDGGTRNSLS